MMRKFVVAVMALSLGMAGLAFAGDIKMGFVNAARLLEEAPQAELATKQLEKEFEPRKDEVVAAQKKLAELEEKLHRDGDIMTESQRRSLERTIVSHKRELRRLQDEFRDDLNFRRNEEISKLQKLVSEIIIAMGKEEKYDLILYEGIAYGDKKIDLTDKVLQRLRAITKGASPPSRRK